MPLAEARVGVMTHALNYGTGCFEGIRAYWNPAHEQLYAVKLPEHYQRFRNSCRVMRIGLPYSVPELVELTLELLRRNGYREDVYVRPLAFKSTEMIGVRLHDVADELTIFASPMGNYVETGGIRCGVSSWRRVDDTMIPPAAKVTGLYVNSALAKTEAIENGFDEAIMLTAAGYVSEGSAENIFLVSGGRLITPSAAEHILVGITRQAVMELARAELGMEVVERQVARSELYSADEVFLCGTGAQVCPVVSVDRRPVGDGTVGPVAQRLQALYFGAVRGELPAYRSWLKPVYARPSGPAAPEGEAGHSAGPATGEATTGAGTRALGAASR
jgi:branched-chain amino acid aminotransferase